MPLPPRPEDRGCRPWAARRPSPSQSHLRIGEIRLEGELCDPFERLDVASSRAADDILGQGRARGRLVPVGRLTPVAHELLVERGLRTTRLVRVTRPEAR